MATQNITLADIKTVKYTSPSQNLSAVEPNIMIFKGHTYWTTCTCGDTDPGHYCVCHGNYGGDMTEVTTPDITWAKPFVLSIPALPTGVASCTVARSSTQATLGSTGTLATAGTSAKTATIYYGDVLSISGTASTGFNNPTVSLSATSVTGNVTASITRGSAKSYTLTVPALPTGIASCTVSRTSSPYGGAATGTLITAGSSQKTATIYYGDVLSISASATTGYNTPTYKLSATTVTGNVTTTLTSGSVKSFTLTISSKPTGVSAHTVSRTSSPLKGASTGALSSGSTIYYGDVLSASATATTGYNNPSLNWTSKTVTGALTSTATAGSVKSFTLSYPAKPTGVSAYTISRTSSPNQGASTGTIVSSPSSAGSVTIYYGDKLSISATAATGYNAPTKSLTATTVSGNVTATVTAGAVKSWTLTINAIEDECGNSYGVASVSVSRTSSPNKGASTGVIASTTSSSTTVTVYYGDVLTASATGSTGYNASLNWTSLTVTSQPTALTATATVKSFTLSYPAKPTGVSAYTITRSSSPLKGATTGTIVNSPTSAGSVTIYYGDKLSISATAATAYNTPTYKLSATTVTANISATVTAGSVKSYTLTVPALPTGVASCTVSRTSSPNKGAATGTLVTAGTSQKTATIYYGDVLSITATASSGYESPTYKLSATTVTGNVTATITAGASSVRWRSIYVYDECEGPLTITTYSTAQVSASLTGVKANVPTKATFSGRINRSDGSYHTINQRTLEESSNGVHTGSGSYSTGSGTFGFNLTMGTNAVLFNAYTSGYIEDECGETYDVGLSSAYVTITEIQQYY